MDLDIKRFDIFKAKMTIFQNLFLPFVKKKILVHKIIFPNYFSMYFELTFFANLIKLFLIFCLIYFQMFEKINRWFYSVDDDH